MGANDKVGNVFLDVLPRGDGFRSGVQAIINKAEADATIAVGANTTQASQAVNQLGQQINDQVGGAWLNAAMQVAGFTAAVFGVRAAVEGTVNKLSGLFDQLAKAQAGFGAIMKSQSQGQGLLNEIREFARVSPFVTQELVNYSQQLLGVGQSAKTIVPLLKNVGDLVSSVGGDTQNIGRVLFTLTQIRSIGRLAGQDAMQLQSALIPITKLLSASLGKTTAEIKRMQEAGSISADQVFAALNAAGEKVSGAMNSATKNISGAKAVLGDTWTIMLQNQPVLNQMFEETYKAILKMADFLGSPAFTEAASLFFDQIKLIHDALLPLFAALAEGGGGGAMVLFKSLTDVLRVVGQVISVIPESFFKVFAQFIILMGSVKAPMMLIQYVETVKRLSMGMLSMGANTKNTTIAIQEQTAAIQGLAGATAELTVAEDLAIMKQEQQGLLSKAKSKVKSLAGNRMVQGMGLMMAGSMVSDQQGGTRDIVGQGLQFAGMGATVAGPWGAAAGAVIGITAGLFSKMEKDAKAKAEAIKKIGSDAADAFYHNFMNQWRDNLGSEAGVRALTAAIGNVEKFISGLGDEVFKNFDYNGQITTTVGGPTGATTTVGGDGIVNYNNLDILRPDSYKSNGAEGGGQANIQDFMNSKGLIPSEIKAIFDAETAKMKEKNPTGVLSKEDLLTALNEEKKTIFAEPEIAKLLKATSQGFFNLAQNLPEGANPLRIDYVKDGGRMGENARSTPEQTAKINREIAILTGQQMPETAADIKVMNDALLSTGHTLEWFNGLTPEVQVQYFRDILPASFLKSSKAAADFTLAMQDAAKSSKERWQPFADEIKLTKESLDATKTLAAQLSNLPKGKDMTASAFSDIAAGITSNSAFDNAAYQKKLAQLELDPSIGPADKKTQASDFATKIGKQTRYGEFKLLQEALHKTDAEYEKLLKTAGAWDAYQAAAGGSEGTLFGSFDKVAAQLNMTHDQLAGILGIKEKIDGKVNIVVTAETRAAALALFELDAKIQAYRGSWQGVAKLGEERAALQAIIDAANASVFKDEPTKNKGGGGAKVDKVLVATDALTKRMQDAANAITAAAEKWVASIKERTQYENAVSTARLIKNTMSQSKDLVELTSGIANLKSRGVTQHVLDLLGIDNVADTKQVRKLVKSSDTDLAKLTNEVKKRDELATTLATNEQQQQNKQTMVDAIVEAADKLGLKPDAAKAADVANHFNISSTMDAHQIAVDIINMLSGARIG